MQWNWVYFWGAMPDDATQSLATKTRRYVWYVIRIDDVRWRHMLVGREQSMTSWLAYINVSLLLNCISMYYIIYVWSWLTASGRDGRQLLSRRDGWRRRGGRFHWLEVNGAWPQLKQLRVARWCHVPGTRDRNRSGKDLGFCFERLRKQEPCT